MSALPIVFLVVTIFFSSEKLFSMEPEFRGRKSPNEEAQLQERHREAREAIVLRGSLGSNNSLIEQTTQEGDQEITSGGVSDKSQEEKQADVNELDSRQQAYLLLQSMQEKYNQAALVFLSKGNFHEVRTAYPPILYFVQDRINMLKNIIDQAEEQNGDERIIAFDAALKRVKNIDNIICENLDQMMESVRESQRAILIMLQNTERK